MGYGRYWGSCTAWSIILSQHRTPAFPTKSPKCTIGLCTFWGFPWKILQHASLWEKINPEGYNGSWRFSSAPAVLEIDFMTAMLGIKIRTVIIRYSVKFFGWIDLDSWHIQEAGKNDKIADILQKQPGTNLAQFRHYTGLAKGSGVI